MPDIKPQNLRDSLLKGVKTAVASFRPFLLPAVCCCCGTSLGGDSRHTAYCPECLSSLVLRKGREAWSLVPGSRDFFFLSSCRYAPPLTHALRALKFHQAWERGPGLAQPLVALWRELEERLWVYGQRPWYHVRGQLVWAAEPPTKVGWVNLWPVTAKGEPRRPDAVIPVPLHPRRLRERGYNQAEELAQALCRATSLTCDISLLQRTVYTARQTELNSAEERAQNVASAFGIRSPEHVRGGFFLLLDDIVTSGATLKSAAEPLRLAGASCVFGLAMASNHRPLAPG